VLIDTHCHLLPGFDDGADTLEAAVAMAKAAAEDGITAVIVTPHYITGLYQPEAETIRRAVSGLQQHLRSLGIALELYSGCEAALDPDLPRWCREGRILTLADRGKHILVELPATDVPVYTEEVLYQLQLAGLTPVLAHPERNAGIQRDPGWLAEMVERGVLVQITAASLTGHFGRTVQRVARQLVRDGTVHLIATDAHSLGGRGPRMKPAFQALEPVLTDEALGWLFYDNPTAIVEGRNVLPFTGGCWLRKRSLWTRLVTRGPRP